MNTDLAADHRGQATVPEVRADSRRPTPVEQVSGHPARAQTTEVQVVGLPLIVDHQYLLVGQVPTAVRGLALPYPVLPGAEVPVQR